MIKMIIAPLLFATLVIGIAGHGDVRNIGKLGIKTIVYFEVITTIALFIGLAAGHIFQPGKGFFVEVSNIQMNLVKAMAVAHHHETISDMLTAMVPTSIVDAMATGNLL